LIGSLQTTNLKPWQTQPPKSVANSASDNGKYPKRYAGDCRH